MRRPRPLLLFALLFAAPALAGDLAPGDLRRSGTVRFPVTCRDEVRDEFQTAVALLHSFFYEEARRRFTEIARRDPECAMAHWGVAMTWYHPLWAPPSPEDLRRGAEAALAAKRIGARSDLERGFIDAMDAYYRTDELDPEGGPVEQSCHGPRAHGARALAFRAALERLAREHSEELEAQVFFALALLATAPPTDATYANQRAAGALLEPLFERHPDHPGIAHYLIHAYDYPSLAERALPAARRYAEIAPWVPHALHMPSHVYTRLGLWAESIASNLASSAAARAYAAQWHGGASIMDDLHALDYLVFAYLQTAREADAGAIVEHVRAIRRFHPERDFAIAYAVGAIPARWTLERRRWADAAGLDLRHAELLGAFPFAEAHVEFARAVGAARSGDVEAARRSVARLGALRTRLDEPKFRWWMDQVEIQRLAASGWLARAEKDAAGAERSLRAAADLEGRAGTHPVTPGQILPAREQLGDLLFELDRPAEAFAEYEASLRAFPNRLNGHLGAARAAARAGKREAAREHYARFVALAREGDTRKEELAEAEAYARER